MPASLKKILNIETRFAAVGEEPMPTAASSLGSGISDVDTRIYQARAVDGDFRLAEALVLSNLDVDPLQRIRTLLSRGDLVEASVAIESILCMAGSAAVSETETQTELLIEALLESARHATFEGEWSLAEKISARALGLFPTGVTQLALRQVRAVSLIETGSFEMARREIDLALSLAKLFPHGSLAVYVQATDARHLVRTGDLALALKRLEQIWKQLSPQTLTVDVCVVLLRIELEIRRQQGEPSSAMAYAIWLLCKQNGDALYEALAIADLPQGPLRERQIAFAARFNRVAKSEAFQAAVFDNSFEPAHLESVTSVLLQHWNIRISTNTLKVERVVYPEQIWRALISLGGQTFSRENFFRNVWGAQKFSSALHDGVIRRLIYRIRRQTSLEVVSQNSEISMPSLLVVPS